MRDDAKISFAAKTRAQIEKQFGEVRRSITEERALIHALENGIDEVKLKADRMERHVKCLTNRARQRGLFMRAHAIAASRLASRASKSAIRLSSKMFSFGSQLSSCHTQGGRQW